MDFSEKRIAFFLLRKEKGDGTVFSVNAWGSVCQSGQLSSADGPDFWIGVSSKSMPKLALKASQMVYKVGGVSIFVQLCNSSGSVKLGYSS